jgi:hypothetical protein
MDNKMTARIIVLRAGINMIIILAVAYLFNFLPEKVGVLRSANDLTTFTPVLAPEFADHLPGLNLWWGLALLFHAALLVMRRWTPALRWAQMALGFVGAYVLARIVFADPFLATPFASGLIRYLLACAALALAFNSARRLNRLVNRRWLVYGSDPAHE